MVGIMGVLIKVVPAPNAKVKTSNTVVVVKPTRVRIPNAADIMNMYADVVTSMRRRSKISDSIPDGNANSKIGREVAVVIRETKRGFGAIEVISHDAPTSYIAAPTYEKSAATHNIRYRLDLKGLKPIVEMPFLSGCLFVSTIEMVYRDLVIDFSLLMGCRESKQF